MFENQVFEEAGSQESGVRRPARPARRKTCMTASPEKTILKLKFIKLII
jgi:hypothetical protein